jgi:sugar lactone lactonase YvrE
MKNALSMRLLQFLAALCSLSVIPAKAVAGTARMMKASPRRQPHILLWMVLLTGWIFSGATASAQVPEAPYVEVALPYGGSTYGYYVYWVAPVNWGGSEITEYKISAKVSPTAANKNAKAKLLGEVTTEFTGIVNTARTKLIVLSSLNNFDPTLASISDSFTCTVSVYAKNASGYSSAGSAVVSGTNTGVYAGRGMAGFSDGQGRSAAFNGISGLAMDSTNTYMYISDQGNHSIRRMNMATDAVNTIAGPAPRPYVDADSAPTGEFADSSTGVTARFNHPSDLALAYTGRYSNAGAGKLIVADTYNSMIRAVDLSTGATTTIAGGALYWWVGDPVGDGGAATAAFLNYPEGVAVDSKGNIYIADTGNRVIRKIDSSDGIIHTIAGGTDNQANTAGLDVNYLDDYDEAQVARVYYAGDGGPATSATLSAPSKLTLDVNDNLYFIDRGNNLVRRIDATTQIITTVAGVPPVADPNNSKPTVDREGYLLGVSSGDGGLATQATLGGPGALNINARSAYLTELMLVESERKLRIVNITSSGNGRIASDKYLASDGRGYTWSSVAPVTSVSAITRDNKGLSSIFYIADAYSIYGEIDALQRRQNYSIDPIPVLSFATPTSASVQVGTTFANVATSSISGEGSGAITYKSSAPSIATVNGSTGLVTGVAAGTVTITATQAASFHPYIGVNDTASTTYELTVAVVPSVASPTSASIGLTSATLGGTVASTGGVTLSARGVVYSRTADNSSPTIGGAGVTNVLAGTTATGAFTIGATGLSKGTTYSFKAYATNSVGTAYSTVGTFTTAVDFTYTATATEVTITGYTGSGGAVTIPSAIVGLPVSSIGSYAFQSCTGLTSVTIPNSVTSIGGGAFYDSTGLNQIQFEGNAPVIISGAFYSLSANANIFVHAGATGFAASYDGVPVVVLPVQTPTIKSALLVAGQFVIQVEGSTAGILLEKSNDLQVWSQVTNAVTTGDSFAIPTNGALKAFYRIGRQ